MCREWTSLRKMIYIIMGLLPKYCDGNHCTRLVYLSQILSFSFVSSYLSIHFTLVRLSTFLYWWVIVCIIVNHWKRHKWSVSSLGTIVLISWVFWPTNVPSSSGATRRCSPIVWRLSPPYSLLVSISLDRLIGTVVLFFP